MRKPRDTSDHAAAVQLEILRRMPGSARLALACEMSDELRAIAADGIRHRHPDYSATEVDGALRELLLRGEPALPVQRRASIR